MDFESRPNVRIVSPKPLTAVELQRIKTIAARVLNQVRSNIRTNMDGKWTPIQWGYQNGLGPGDLALQGTEDQWTIEALSSRQFKVKPKQGYEKMWKGHVNGVTIVAKDNLMPVPFAPKTKFMRQVTLPKRDPRPTATQLSRIVRGS